MHNRTRNTKIEKLIRETKVIGKGAAKKRQLKKERDIRKREIEPERLV